MLQVDFDVLLWPGLGIWAAIMLVLVLATGEVIWGALLFAGPGVLFLYAFGVEKVLNREPFSVAGVWLLPAAFCLGWAVYGFRIWLA